MQINPNSEGELKLLFAPCLKGGLMTCDPSIFEDVPLFALLDADERAVLAENVALFR